MSETSQIVWDTAARLFTEQFTPQELHRAEAGEWLGAQWDRIEELGLPLALVPEEDGGVGLDAIEGAMLVRIAGSFAVPLPLPETMLANRLLAAAGLPLAAGPATVAPVRLDDRLTLARTEGGWRLSGVAHRVPWGRSAAVLVGLAEHEGRVLAVRLTGAQVRTEPGVNLACEPRDTLRIEGVAAESAVAPLPDGFGLAECFAMGAALRTAAIAGAVGRVLEMTVGYANDRVQFGRPIGKFQAIQQSLAIMAGHAAAAAGSADVAAEAMHDGTVLLPIAAAKARAGEAAGSVATIAHQVHGAIGFTHEHSLHFLTKRLWSWRDEFGNEAHWNRVIGRRMIAAGADGVWPLIAAL
ncbi:alkylation response protein AidB-like acyl-CoA dehydrogenase [Azospirillum agricola]|uniref:acyl-CoA dehydrogenase family protein n=1 Tax=Azospirillum agricola TaxID=1720247 RepID=UPI001AE9112F|nr:acyl-CoA dehydrogenase family protein [Azospirillum agricola]MBP2229407.1 alkylation response protein AidB-like acyl-CoA dehydrogenase [Azospirillum agricola]